METQQPFGGVPSPTNFDKLAKTKDLLVCLESGTLRSQVFRALDDSPCIAPLASGVVESFSRKMKEFCLEMDIPLAENCPKAEKAFVCQTKGTVLGVGFDSNSMSWFFSKEKAEKVVKRCLDVAGSTHVDLKQMQQLMGSVNDLGQMCPTVKFHKRAGNVFLASFEGNYQVIRMVPEKLKKELLVIAKVAEKAQEGLPIAERQVQPSLNALVFYTDAAGASFTWSRGERVFHNNEDRGVACIGGTEIADIWCWSRVFWPPELLTSLKDDRGRSFGSKSTTLEAVGMLLPFLAFPDRVRGKNIVFKIDNMAVLFGWYNGYVKQDETASEVLKSVQYISSVLGTVVNVQHVGRVSDELAELADELSRRKQSKKPEACKALESAEFREVSSFLTEWLADPCGGSKLCGKLLKEMN